MKLLLSTVMLFGVHLLFAQNYSKVKIYTDQEGLQRLAELGVGVDHGTYKQNTFFISDFSEAEVEIMASNGYMFEILIDDVKAYYKERNETQQFGVKNATCSTGGVGNSLPPVPVNFETDPGSYAGFYQYQEMLDELDAMAAQYPNLITVKAPISTFLTWEGRPIYHVKISDNPNTDEESEPKVLYSAIHHAREPMSMSQTIFYMWYLLENYATSEEIQFLVDNTEMYFVPCLNPDGYIHNEAEDPSGFGMHRKNKRPVGTTNPGVDLNRNYSYGWNTTGVSGSTDSDVYPGTSEFSEPETQAMKWLVENVGFTSAFNAHTYGNTLLYPIGTTEAEFADHHDYFADLSGHMCSHNGYFPQKSSGLYPASGDSDDYMYKMDIGVGMKDTIFAITPEIGTGFWPAASEVIPTCQEMVFPNLVLSHMTHQYYTADETDPSTIATLTGDFNHEVLRLGLVDGDVTISIEPLLNIQSVGADVLYNLDLRQSSTGTISYVLDPAIQFGDEVRYILKTEYIGWTRRDTIVKTYGAITLQEFDDGSNTVNWTGNWGSTTSTFYSSPSCFADSPVGNYQNDANRTYEYNNAIDLTNVTAASISFYAKWEIEADYDYCQFQVSTDGGSSWIGQCGNYTVEGTSANGSAQPDGEPVYEGFQTSWVLEEISLSDYIGQTINVRFLLESDGGVREDGFFFDDFSVLYNIDDAGIEENVIEMKMFPNPATDNVTISLSKVISTGELKVFDQSGKVVLTKTVDEQTNKIELSVDGLKQGIYTVHLGEFAQPSKLVVMH